MSIPLVVLCGPTAGGKTDLALRLAERFPVEVVSADSRQVYRGMDIGTAKASPAEQRRLPHHLIDLVEPDQPFSVADFTALGHRIIAEIAARGRHPLLVGGTGLYIRALTEGLIDAPGADPELRARLHALEDQEGEGALHRRLSRVDPAAAAAIHPRNRVRIVRALEVHALTGQRLSELQQQHGFGDRPYPLLKIGVLGEKEALFERIDRRVEAMLAAGLIDEVRRLLERGFSEELKAFKTIGYQETIAYLHGRCDRAELCTAIQHNTRRFAKRQLTWFRRDPEIIWVDSLVEFARIEELIGTFYVDQRSGHGQDPV